MFYAKEDHEGVHWVLYFKSFKVGIFILGFWKKGLCHKIPFICFNHFLAGPYISIYSGEIERE